MPLSLKSRSSGTTSNGGGKVSDMPTYEYECRSCKHQFEKFESIMAKPVAACPKCKKSARRLISAGGGVLFKGSGFYETDYRSANYKKGAAADTKPAAKPAACASGSGSCASGKKTP